MSKLKLSVRSTIFISLLPLLSACGAYQTSGVTPARSRLVSITTTSGAVLKFDTLPAAQIIGDTVYGRRDGVPCAIPAAEVAVTTWMALPGEQPVSGAIADHGQPTGSEPPALASGAHVRITAPTLGWDGKTGDVVAVHGDTLLLRRGGGLLSLILSPRPVPLSAVTALEVSRNHGAHEAAAWVGYGVGAVGGFVVGYHLSGPCPSGLSTSSINCVGNRFLATLLGGTLGGGLGGLIGYAAVPEVWTTVGLAGARPSLVPLPGGHLGLGVTLAF